MAAGLSTWPQQLYLPNQNLMIISSFYSRPVCKAFEYEKNKAYKDTIAIFIYLDLFQVWLTLIFQGFIKPDF